MKIGDLVSLDDKAEFRSAVQLSAYDEPAQNLSLLRSYLFSSAIPSRSLSQTRDVSSIDLLKQMTNIHLDATPNCLCLIADFGHGKSHLALVLANYFGRAADSPEVKEITEKIKNAVGDKAGAAHFTDFKRNTGEFLLIRLRGDGAGDLRSQFLKGLERALAEHEATRDAKTPFWFVEAARLLDAMSSDEKARANAKLAEHGRDLPLLRQQIDQRQDVYDQTVAALEAAKGMTPGFSEVGLADALRWASDNYVATGKLGGILVLFDEFTLYVDRYGHRSAAADLQELLGGVDNLRGRALFLALATADPETTADNLDSLKTDGRTSLKKALNRLEIKRRLSTLLESVIDAYLFQDEVAWATLKQSPYFNGALTNASTVAYERFAARYQETLHWSTTTFQDNVTRGCFPLHPITTYLLCNMPLGTKSDSGSARTMLGFVRSYLEARQPQPAMMGNRPNWVLPVHLLDYFEEHFFGASVDAYQTAVRAAGPDAAEAQRALLKALLLQQLAGVMSRRGDDQLAFLAQSTGLDEATAKAELKALSKATVIEFQDNHKTYSLFPARVNYELVKRKLDEKMGQLPFDADALTRPNNPLVTELPPGTFGDQPIQVDWGLPGEWAARQQLLTVEGFSAERMREAVSAFGFGPRGEQLEGHRAYVFWLLARTDDEVGRFRQEAQQVVDQAFPGEFPTPVVVVLPDRPQLGLIDAFQRLRALEALSNSEREEIGPEMLKQVKVRAIADLLSGLQGVRGDNARPFDLLRDLGDYVMPDAYRRRLQATAVSGMPLGQLVRDSYDWAYPFRPQYFDQRYPAAGKGGDKFKKSVVRVAESFLKNESCDLPRKTGASDGTMRDLFNNILRDRWKLLRQDYSLQPPPAPGLQRAWVYLDTALAPGQPGKLLGTLLSTLLNPPYGYDYHTALLLFAGWVGYHGSDVQFSLNNRLVKVDALENALSKNAKDFFKQVYDSRIAVARRDPSQFEKTVRDRLATLGQGAMERQAAQNTLTELGEWVADVRLDERLRDEVAEASQRLQQAIGAADQYDKDAATIDQALKGADLPTLLAQRRKAGNLAPVFLVNTKQLPPAELQAAVDNAIDSEVDRLAARWGKLDNLGDHSRNRDRLQTDRKRLQDAGLTDAAQKLDAALAQLEAQAQALQLQQEEKPKRDQIAAMRTDLPLSALYEQRDNLKGLQVVSESIIALRDQKLEATKAEIARLEREARALPEVILACTDAKVLRDTRDSLLRSAGRYEGTPWTEALNNAQTLIDRCEQFLARLGAVERGADALSSPDDVLSLQAALSQLETEDESWVGDKQRALLQQAQARVEKRATDKEAEATRWFQQIETAARNQTALGDLQNKLKTAPPFLNSEQAMRVQELRGDVERAIDQDVVAKIEQQFRAIHDPQLQQACLVRLQQIAHESGIRADGEAVHR